MSFSEKLRTARRNAGLTQESLGLILNVSRQSITKWENGESYPDVQNLLLLASKLGVGLDVLFSDELSVQKGKDNELSLEAETLLETDLLGENKQVGAASKILNEIISNQEDDEPISTGIGFIDSIEGGLRRRNIYLLAGPAKIGKTALAMAIINRVADTQKVIVYTYADTSKDLYAMILANESGIPTTRSYVSSYSRKQREQLRESIDCISHKKLEIKERFRGDYEIIREELSAETEKPDLIVLDSLHDISLEDEGRFKRIMNKLSFDNNCPILILDRTKSDVFSLDPKIYSESVIKGWWPKLLILNRQDYYDISYRRADDCSICNLCVFDSDLQELKRGHLLYHHKSCRFDDYCVERDK